jgi:hypothetical protein
VIKRRFKMSLQKPDFKRPVFKLMPQAKISIENGECPTCGREIQEKDFKDEASRREYSISGMCQWCQNKIFNGNR